MAHFCTAAAMLGLNMCENQTPMTHVESQFIQHMNEHNLSYGTKEEYAFRFGLFKKADEDITKINTEEKNFVVGHNQFSTWTKEEFNKLLGTRTDANPVFNLTEEEMARYETFDGPNGTDWRDDGVLNPVQNQGQCGSCWAFSATAVIEAHHAIQF
jgi:C1A family cysteine protease